MILSGWRIMRRGALSSVFSFIFAIVVGAMVFLLLIGFAAKYMGFIGALGAAETVNALQDTFAAFSFGSSAETVVDVGQGFSFTLHEGAVQTGTQVQGLDQVVFGPLHVEGKQLFVATRTVFAPFPAGNVFYVADGRTVVVFVYDSKAAGFVGELVGDAAPLFPKNFPSYAFSVDDVSLHVEELASLLAGYEAVRFVLFTEDVAEDLEEQFPDADVLFVESSDADYDAGMVRFADGQEYLYVGAPLLFGAIVSSDGAAYAWNLEQVLDGVSVVAGVYVAMGQYLSSAVSGCSYSVVVSSLTALQRELAAGGSSQALAEKIDAVREAEAEVGGGCPELF